MANRLANKTALITGGNSGIGLATAKLFVAEGAKVTITGRNKETLAAAAKELGPNAFAVVADVNDVAATEAAVKQAAEKFGKLDIVFANAGIPGNTPVGNTSLDAFEQVIRTNLTSVFFTVQAALPYLNDNASIILNGSVISVLGNPGYSAYAATKGAIIAHTRALAVEVAHRGIRVNAIAPGWITVENYFKAIPGFTIEGARKSAENAVPAARYGLPIDVARLATFLSSDDASFLVGQTIVLDGGTVSLMSLISDFRTESTSKFGEDYILGQKKS